MKTAENRTKETIRRLLDLLADPRVSAPQKDRIRGWFIRNDKRELKDEAYRELFFDTVEARQPDDWAYESLARLKKTMGTIPETATVRLLPEQPMPVKRVPIHKRMAFRIAAVLIPLLVIAGAIFLTVEREAEQPLNLIAVVASIQEEIALPDGSVVRLKPGGRLEYREDFATDRLVTLQGEAFFSVTGRNGAPFRVETGKLTITVLGTEFNVKAYTGDREEVVSLASGKVEMESEDHTVHSLSPSEQYVYDRTTGEGYIEPFDPESLHLTYLDKLHLDGLPLHRALEAIGQFKGAVILIDAGVPADRTVRTTFTEEDSLEEILSIVQTLTDAFDYRMEENVVRVVPKK